MAGKRRALNRGMEWGTYMYLQYCQQNLRSPGSWILHLVQVQRGTPRLGLWAFDLWTSGIPQGLKSRPPLPQGAWPIEALHQEWLWSQGSNSDLTIPWLGHVGFLLLRVPCGTWEHFNCHEEHGQLPKGFSSQLSGKSRPVIFRSSSQ